MSVGEFPIWKQAPFIRLILPFTTGICIECYIGSPVASYTMIMVAAGLLIFVFGCLPTSFQFRFYWLTGLWMNLLLAAGGGMITYLQDVRNHSTWLNKVSHREKILIATLQGLITEKGRSYKANASCEYVLSDYKLKKIHGNIIIYFEKGPAAKRLSYNTRISFRKVLQPIRKGGNPAAFEYSDYCALQQIYHQVYLKPGEYRIVAQLQTNRVKSFLLKAREKVVLILKRFIPGRSEAGLAEALLIGYKDDLEKSLVQSYSNTGVVHVIAISGLHLGLIYWLLSTLLRPVVTRRYTRMLKPVFIIAGLWIFSVLAGASPSVLRSAVMFTFIVIGETSGKKTSIYNSLAASAFLLLCYNPFWLWDAGFQLSYIAVLSLVIFMQPIYNLLYIKNKILDVLWKLTAVTMAAQVLTLPIGIYLFHQFPNYFLLTNLVAIPLSSIILLGELFLCAIAMLPEIAEPTGLLLQWLIGLMNDFIRHVERMPASNFTMLQVSLIQVVLLYAFIIAMAYWLFRKQNEYLLVGLFILLAVLAVRIDSFYKASRQRKLIVYNCNRQAVEIIKGRDSYLISADSVWTDGTVESYSLRPARIIHRIGKSYQLVNKASNLSLQLEQKRILIITTATAKMPGAESQLLHLVIFSHNPTVSIARIASMLSLKMIVFDGSNSLKKVNRWKRECYEAGIACWPVAEKGAFIINLN